MRSMDEFDIISDIWLIEYIPGGVIESLDHLERVLKCAHPDAQTTCVDARTIRFELPHDISFLRLEEALNEYAISLVFDV